jgi:hypothetical protein
LGAFLEKEVVKGFADGIPLPRQGIVGLVGINDTKGEGSQGQQPERESVCVSLELKVW